MTVRQLHYTSTRDGRDGIDGFQVAAATIGISQQHEDLALPLSAYRPPPGAPPVPTAEQIAELPVAFGYTRRAGFAVLFCSRYLGVDFTGRQGNYFAHVLVLDNLTGDLGGLLPAEAWDSPQWTSRLDTGTELPLAGPVRPGPLADRHVVREHLQQGLLPGLEAVLDAVRAALSGATAKVVVVAADPADVALVLTAVSRSLPPALVAGMSFVTYSAAPGDHDVLVVGTTPDVAVPAGAARDRLIVRLDEPEVPADPAHPRYAGVLARCWTAGLPAVEAAVDLAGRADPPLRADELDPFADLVELAAGRAGQDGALRGLEFAVARLPVALDGDLWRRLDDAVAGTGPADVARWSAALTTAAGHQRGPGPALEAAYLAAVLSGVAGGELAPGEVWFPPRSAGSDAVTVAWALDTVREQPTLDTVARVLDTLARRGIDLTDADLDHIVDVALLPALFDPDDASPASRLTDLPGATRLLRSVCALLEDRLDYSADLFDHAVSHLSPAAAEVLTARARSGTRCATAAALALARVGRTDRVPTLTAVLSQTPIPLRRVADLIWTDLPTAAEGAALCRAVGGATLAASGLPERLVQRLVVDARAGELGITQAHLATALGGDRALHDGLRPGSADLVDAIWLGAHFQARPVRGKKEEDRAVTAARLADDVEPAVAEWLRAAVAGWLLVQDSTLFHAPVLLRIAQGPGGAGFLDVYGPALAETLRTAEPPMIAAVLPAVVFLANEDKAGQHLLDTTCSGALARRRAKDLDLVGRALEARQSKLRQLAPGNAPDWASWWSDYRGQHALGRSVLGGLLRRLSPGGDR